MANPNPTVLSPTFTPPAKITGFTIQDFKRIRLVEIHPDENGLTIIGGRNAQGKSSCLDAIAYALGGEFFRPSNINNLDGEKNAAIRVEIDGLVVERAGKNAALKVTDARGMRGNQTLLNDIVSRFALDLGGFMRASATDKTKMLLKMFPELDAHLTQIKKESDTISAERADINRDIKRLTFQFDAMPFFDGLPAEEISMTDLTMQLNAVNSDKAGMVIEARQLDDLRNRQQARQVQIEQARAAKEKAQKEIDSLEERIRQMRLDAETALRDADDYLAGILKDFSDTENDILNRSAAWQQRGQEVNARAEKINCDIAAADANNVKIRKNAERKKLFDEINDLRKESGVKTAQLNALNDNRIQLLTQTDLPLPELSISPDGELLYRGQQWDCMSGSERLIVATSICMKSKPGCGFVLIDGLEAMDPQTLAEFSEYLQAHSMQGIGTIVGDNAATVIIEDGYVQEPAAMPEK